MRNFTVTVRISTYEVVTTDPGFEIRGVRCKLQVCPSFPFCSLPFPSLICVAKGVHRGADAPQGYTKQIFSVCGLQILMLHAFCIKNALEYTISRLKKIIFWEPSHTYPFWHPLHETETTFTSAPLQRKILATSLPSLLSLPPFPPSLCRLSSNPAMCLGQRCVLHSGTGVSLADKRFLMHAGLKITGP